MNGAVPVSPFGHGKGRRNDHPVPEGGKPVRDNGNDRHSGKVGYGGGAAGRVAHPAETWAAHS